MPNDQKYRALSDSEASDSASSDLGDAAHPKSASAAEKGGASPKKPSLVEKVKKAILLPGSKKDTPNSTKDEQDGGGAAKPKRGPMMWYILAGVIIAIGIIIVGGVLKARSAHAGELVEESHKEEADAEINATTGLTSDEVVGRFPELRELLQGNRDWIKQEEQIHPGLIKNLSTAQHPPFVYLGCSDSRVPETDIFDSQIGELFVHRNIGNQYRVDDLSAQTALTYGVEHLGVKHILVMGHYGCGAVQASIASPSEAHGKELAATRVESWIMPIRHIFNTSDHKDIVAFREAHKSDATIAAPNQTEPAFRALVEENVKQTVLDVARDEVVRESWAKYREADPSSSKQSSEHSSRGRLRLKRSSEESAVPALWIHGWVYDIATGLVTDLGVSMGP